MPSPGPTEILVIIAIAAMFVIPVVIVVNLLRSNTRSAGSDRDPAIDILRQRLAKGEIDEIEFQRLRSALQGR
jgi:putative membrane protein